MVTESIAAIRGSEYMTPHRFRRQFSKKNTGPEASIIYLRSPESDTDHSCSELSSDGQMSITSGMHHVVKSQE